MEEVDFVPTQKSVHLFGLMERTLECHRGQVSHCNEMFFRVAFSVDAADV